MWRFMRRIAAETGNPYADLLIALRHEHGDKGGRPHFHFLLGGRSLGNIRSLCFRQRYWWKQLTGGMSIVSPYADTLPGVAYVLKGLREQAGHVYELGKFGLEGNDLTLSRSVVRYLRARVRFLTDGAGSTTRKNGRLTGRAQPASQAKDQPRLACRFGG